MKRRHLAAVTIAACLAVGLALPASAAPPGLNSDLVDRYTQQVYELESPSVMKIQETVVDTNGRILARSTAQQAVATRPVAATQAQPFSCLNDRDREGFQRHPMWEMLDRERTSSCSSSSSPTPRRVPGVRMGGPRNSGSSAPRAGLTPRTGPASP